MPEEPRFDEIVYKVTSEPATLVVGIRSGDFRNPRRLGALEGDLGAVLRLHREARVLVDCSRVEGTTSRFVAVLSGLAERAAQQGIRVRICGSSPRLLHFLQAGGLDRYGPLDISPDAVLTEDWDAAAATCASKGSKSNAGGRQKGKRRSWWPFS